MMQAIQQASPLSRTARALDGLDLYNRVMLFAAHVHAGRMFIEHRETTEIVPWRFNSAQKRLTREILRQAGTCPRCEHIVTGWDTVCPWCLRDGETVERGIPVRIRIPKARKEGVSTWVQLLFLFLTENFPNRQARTLAHTATTTRNIFRIAATAFRRGEIIDDGDPGVTGITFAHGSIYQCMTAGGDAPLHGDTVHYLHLSEVAYILAEGKVDAGTLQGTKESVPKTRHTIIIEESTGDGPGTFKKWCDDALAGIGGFKLVFFPWYFDDDYRRDPTPGFTLTDDERAMKTAFALEDAQVYFYRCAFEAACGDGRDLSLVAAFKRYYPTTYDDCWLVSGGQIFTYFSRQTNVRTLTIQPHWQRYRAIDFGASFEHPFVCLWVAHDPTGPPRLVFLDDPGDKAMQEAIDDFLKYRRHEKTGKPLPRDDHAVSSLAYLVTTERLTGTTYVYRAYYDRNPPPMNELCRRLHEMSGWTPGDRADANNPELQNYVAGKDGERYESTICDRARLDSIQLLNEWGLDCRGYSDPPVKRKGAVEDRIAWLHCLIIGSSEFFIDAPDRVEEMRRSAADKALGRTPTGRPVELTREEARVLEGDDPDDEEDLEVSWV